MTESLSDARLFELLDTHAPWGPTALVPELSAWQAADEQPLWQALEECTGRLLPPPFFCTAWPGAQALALALATRVVDVRGRRVADVGAGSGLASAAAMRSGAAAVLALDVDELARRAARELGRRHGVVIDASETDALAHPAALAEIDMVLAGDLVYAAEQRPLLERAVDLWRRRSVVVLADSGRPFFDCCGLPLVFECVVPVSPGVDTAQSNARTVRVYCGGPTA